MSSLLLGDRVIVVQPALVKALDSISDAVVIQQLHYWTPKAESEYDGHIWVYKTYEEWSEEIGLSPRQIRYSMTRLEALGVVISCQPEGNDRRKWYRIDYAHALLESNPEPIRQNRRMEATKSSVASDKIGASTSITEITTEITQETKVVEQSSPEASEICFYLAKAIELRGLRPRPREDWITGANWLSEARKLLEGKVGRKETLADFGTLTVAQIKASIDYAMNDEFWADKIYSMGKLRVQYPTLRAQAKAAKEKAPKGSLPASNNPTTQPPKHRGSVQGPNGVECHACGELWPCRTEMARVSA